ncbi:MAG: hypothetical protein ACMUIA_01060 [bacterium]
MKIAGVIILLILVLGGLSAANPIILLSDDIADGYLGEPLDDLRMATNWFGLYIQGSDSQIKPARLDLISKREQSETIYSVITDPPKVEVLFSGVPIVSPGPVVTVDRFVDMEAQNRRAEFRLDSRVYSVQLHSSNADLCDAVITLSDGHCTQKVFQLKDSLPYECGEPHFRIHWVGDMDRDGGLDLLVTFSPKYSVHPRQLFLSSAAKAGDLVAEVAIHLHFAQ